MLGLPITLPWFIALHASGLCAVGLSLIFKPTSPTKPASSNAVLGIATVGLGLAYLSTSYMPISENAFLYASVPVRIILAALAAVKAGLGAGEEERTLWGVAAYDGLGGVVLGFWLGKWDGRVPL
jgi:hypothetical protein